MGKHKKTLWPLLVSAVWLGSYIGFSGNAIAQSKVQPLLVSTLYGNIPNVTIRGVVAGNAPWIVWGHVTLTNNHLSATGKGLIVPVTGYMANGAAIPKSIAGTTIGIPTVEAEITFANQKSVITAPVKLNAQGDFTINTSVALPKNSAQPVVLIGPGTKSGLKAWFASTDFLMAYGAASKGPSSLSHSSW